VLVDHIPLERLINAATIDELILTPAEFDHVKNCSACFGTWVRFIKDLMSIASNN